MSICKITTINIPAQQREDFEQSFAFRRGFVDIVDGFEGLQLLRPTVEDGSYQLLTFWRDEESYRAWREENPRRDDERSTHHVVANYDIITDVKPIRE